MAAARAKADWKTSTLAGYLPGGRGQHQPGHPHGRKIPRTTEYDWGSRGTLGLDSRELISTPSSPIVNMEYMVKEITLGKPPPLSAPIRVSVPYQSVLKQVHYVLCDPTATFIILPSPYHQLPVPLGSPVCFYVGQALYCLAVPWLVQVGGGWSFPLEQLHSTPSLIST